MSTFKRSESNDLGCRRLLCEQVESAIGELTRKDGSARSAANALCRAEAALSLIEPALPRDIARRERGLLQRIETELREAIGPTRLLAALDKHVKINKPQDPAAKAYRKQLNRRAGTALSLSAPDRTFNPLVYRLVADLAELRGHIGTRPELDLAQDGPPPGLRRAYAAARRAVQSTATTPKDAGRTAAALDRVALQLAMVNRCAPTLLKPQRKLLAAAATDLRRHALSLQLLADLDTDAHRNWAEPILKAIVNDAPAPDPEALLGSALAETPAGFARRLGVYWNAWRKSGTA